MRKLADPISRGAVAVLALLGLGLAVAAAMLFPTITPDGFLYLGWADHLRAHGLAPMPGLPEKFLPLYPALMALVSALSGGAVEVESAGRAISAVCGAALCPLVFILARQAGAGGRAAVVSAIAAALVPIGIDQFRDVNVMPLFAALTALFFVLQGRGRLFAAGLVAGLALTARFEGFLLLPAALMADWRDRRGLLRLALGVVIAGGAWWLRNLYYHGAIVHTYYMAELIAFKFHLPRILLGLVGSFGPVATLGALAARGKIPRRQATPALVFALLFLALHSWWWFYRDRFLLPLLPVVFPAAAAWLSAAWARPGRRWLGPALAAGLIAPVALQAGFWLSRVATESPDPYVQAARALATEPPDTLLLGSNPLLLQRVSGHPSASFDGLPAGVDPQAVVARLCRDRPCALVWNGGHPADVTLFPLLADGRRHQVMVDTADGRVEIAYVFFREYQDARGRALVYDIILRDPAAPGAVAPY